MDLIPSVCMLFDNIYVFKYRPDIVESYGEKILVKRNNLTRQIEITLPDALMDK